MRMTSRRKRSSVPIGLVLTGYLLLGIVAIPSVGVATSESAQAAETIYVDLFWIEEIPGLTAEQKAELKEAIRWDVERNFEVSLGPGKVVVSTNPADEATAARRAYLKNNTGSYVDSDGNTQYYYGEWPSGSKDVNVHLKNFTERHADDYKTGGNWDLDKLRRGIGRTIAHELAHSYSVGHNSNASSPDKMTEGGLVPSATRATTLWVFDLHTDRVLEANLGKKPCETAQDYDVEFLRPLLWDGPVFPDDPDEYRYFDARFSFSGALADQFDLGWLGHDSDGGAGDGNSRFDFVYKTSMDGSAADAPQLTFFVDAHTTVQLVLRGRQGTPYAGLWFVACGHGMSMSDRVVRPDGVAIYRHALVRWDVNDDGLPDVSIELDSANVYPEYPAAYNGWKLITGIPNPPPGGPHRVAPWHGPVRLEPLPDETD
jgi:hypothetical protein